MTITQFFKNACDHARTGQREGQALFNALYDAYPDSANSIRGTDADPFYATDCHSFYAWLIENWPGTWD